MCRCSGQQRVNQQTRRGFHCSTPALTTCARAWTPCFAPRSPTIPSCYRTHSYTRVDRTLAVTSPASAKIKSVHAAGIRGLQCQRPRLESDTLPCADRYVALLPACRRRTACCGGKAAIFCDDTRAPGRAVIDLEHTLDGKNDSNGIQRGCEED